MKLLSILLFSICIYTSQAQVGDTFPDMKCESLTNQFINLPADSNGKYSLVCMAYSVKAEDYLAFWFSPIYNNFIYKPETPSAFSFSYDINTYFIPMFTGAKRVAYEKAMKKVQKSVDPLIQPYVLFHEGTVHEYEAALSKKAKDLPYFYILDPKGKIIYTTEGIYTEFKMQEIINAVGSSLEQKN